MPNVPPPHAKRAAFTSVSMASDGTMWAVNADQQALRHTGNGNFGQVGERPMSKISVGSSAISAYGNWAIWAIDSSGRANNLRSTNWGPDGNLLPPPAGDPTAGTSWSYMDSWQPPALIAIAGAADETVWGIDQNNNPIRYIATTEGSWEVPGGVGTPTSVKATQIAVGSRNFVCCINLDGAVQRYDYMGVRWQPPLPALPTSHRGDGRAISVAVGKHGIVWAVGTEQLVYQLTPAGDAWLDTDWGPVTQIAAGDAYNLIGLTPTLVDRDGHSFNDVWVSNSGPVGVPRIVVPPPPPVVEFRSPAIKVTGPTGSAPALASFNREVCAVYQNDGQDHMFSFRSSSNEGGSWRSGGGYQPGVGIPGIIDGIGGAPALVVLNGALHCAYQANDTSNLLYVTRTYDGVVWMSPRQVHITPNGDGSLTVNYTTNSAPALVAFGNRLYCAFQANDHSLYVISSADGDNWSMIWSAISTALGSGLPSPSAILIGSAPALAVFNGTLYCAFRANDARHILYVTSSGDGQNWVTPANGIPGIAIGSAPALAAFDNKLYCAYQADDSTQALCVTSSADGANWDTPRVYGGIPIGSAPALCVLGRRLYVGFQNSADHCVYVNSTGA
jgi:hypothetical protein